MEGPKFKAPEAANDDSPLKKLDLNGKALLEKKLERHKALTHAHAALKDQIELLIDEGYPKEILQRAMSIVIANYPGTSYPTESTTKNVFPAMENLLNALEHSYYGDHDSATIETHMNAIRESLKSLKK